MNARPSVALSLTISDSPFEISDCFFVFHFLNSRRRFALNVRFELFTEAGWARLASLSNTLAYGASKSHRSPFVVPRHQVQFESSLAMIFQDASSLKFN